jgi:hypothetical protein
MFMVIFGSDMDGLDLEGLLRTPGITPAHPELTWLARAQGGEAHPPERERQCRLEVPLTPPYLLLTAYH